MGYMQFDFVTECYDEAQGTSQRTRAQCSPRNVRLTQTLKSGAEARDVSVDDSGEDVRLNVSGVGVDGVSLAEPDILTLRRQHPREAARWLLPLLRDLGQEQLLDAGFVDRMAGPGRRLAH